MKAGFIFFIVILLLGVSLGYFVHEAQDEKVRYERDTCYERMNQRNFYTNINNISDVIYYDERK